MGVKETNEELPIEFNLEQNYPNPFNPSTTISYQLKTDCYITLTVYDLLGREIKIIDKGYKKAGQYSTVFEDSKFSSEIYFAQLKAIPINADKPFIKTIKMVMAK